jgi:hypothetical protein
MYGAGYSFAGFGRTRFRKLNRQSSMAVTLCCQERLGGVTVVLLVAALFGAGAYFLRFSLCGRKPIGVDHAARAFAENRHAATSRRTCS